MKKLLLALAFAGVAAGGFAQDTETDPVQKYSVATNSFWSNWFIQAGAEWNAWYSGEEHGNGFDKSPFKKFRSEPAASIAIGKWFTPGLGLRTKLQGIWGKSVTDEDNYGNFNKYWILNEHIMFNLSNLFCGYNPTRVWNFIVFAGGGIGRSMTHNLYAMDLSAGIQSQWRLSKHVSIYLEGGWNRLENDIDGYEGTDGNRGWETHDNDLYAELGLNFNLGKATWEKVPDVDAIKALSQSQIDALNAQLNDANAENARLKNLLANQKPAEDKAVKEFVTTPVSVFFNINKTNIASQKDLVNVEALAKYAKENNCKLDVTGYADSATGTAEYNQKLSEGRAATVADELVKMGVDRSNINTVGKGGVDELSPVSFNRRATVKVAE
ncbi:MAG: OmpA family protein [Prevotella sp.]|jgi:OOP family OmpA-OmpF porin